jgi:hypothetical protein
MISSEVRTVNLLRATPVAINWHNDLPIYASEGFLKSMGDEYAWIGGFDESGQLRCVLPYTIMRKLGFRMVRFRVETIPLGRELDEGEEKSFLNSVVDHFRSNRVDMIIPSNNTAIFRTYPDGALAAPYGTFINELNQSDEVLMGNIRKTYRNNIRRAVKAGIQIKCGMEYFDTSYNLIAETLGRSDITFKTRDELKRTVLALGENVKIFAAEHEGVLQGCLIAPFSKHTAYNWYCGSKNEPMLGAMHLLHWEAIRHFREMGVKRFNFQGVRINPKTGSKQEGILNYKKGFGGELVQGYVWKYRLRTLKWAAYSVAVRLLMGGDFVDQERSKLVPA